MRKQKIGTGPTHSVSRKISIFRSTADRPSRPHCWARFNRAVPVWMGVMWIISVFKKMNNRSLLAIVASPLLAIGTVERAPSAR
jgi:hypothetical protein